MDKFIKPIFRNPPYRFPLSHYNVNILENYPINISNVVEILKTDGENKLYNDGVKHIRNESPSIKFIFVGGKSDEWCFPNEESRDKEYERIMEEYK